MDVTYKVYPVILPFKGIEDSFEKQEWCFKHFGSGWVLQSNEIRTQEWLFSEEKHAVEFALRWA